jgi:nitroreductase
MDVLEAIRYKRAVRAFAPTPLEADTIEAILQAGRRSQSAKNRQPWHFIALTDRDKLRALSELGTYASHLAGAALGVAILTPDPAQRWSILFDAGQAAAYMQLAAWQLGVGSCLATIYQSEAARQLLGFPPELQLHVAISFGYPQNPAVLTERPRPGGRKAFDDIIHHNGWS